MPDDSSAEITAETLTAIEGGAAVLVATIVAAPESNARALGAKMLVRPDGTTLGSLGAGLDDAVKAEGADAFRRGAVETLYYAADAKPATRQTAAYAVMVEVHQRPARLLIVGGGHVGKALAVIGSLCGYTIEVVDDRPEFANAERFPEADRISCGRFDEVLQDYPIDVNTSVICVTRGHKHDETSLRLVAPSAASYVGMIGSKRRVRAVLQHLIEDGLDPASAERVHTPIGLDIGAETPEEIAVSIMAEIIQARRGGTGGSMRSPRQTLDRSPNP